MSQDALRIYADENIGAYGYQQPWFQPHLRQNALLKRLHTV